MTVSPVITLEDKNGVNAPMSPAEIEDTVHEGVSSISDVNELSKSALSKSIQSQLVNYLLQKLSSKSSQFKYIVNATIIDTVSGGDSFGLLGTVWDSAKDGTTTVKVKLDEQRWVLISVIWIHT